MADLNLDDIKANVSKMIDQGAPEADIDDYLSYKGVTAEQLRSAASGTASGSAPADAGDASAAVGRGLINGIPIAGPYLLSGVNKAVAGVRSLQNDTRYSDELKNVEGFSDKTAAEHPLATSAGEIGGAVAGMAPMVAAAPAAFGLGEGALLARSLASAGSGGLLSGADAVARGQDPRSASEVGATLGFASPMLGAAIGKGVGALSSAFGPSVDGLNSGAKWIGSQIVNENTPGRLLDIGPLGSVADTSEAARGVAMGIPGKTGSAAGDRLTNFLKDREAGTGDRVMDAWNSQLGPAISPSAARNDIEDRLGTEMNRRYAEALRSPAEVNIAPVVSGIDAAMPISGGDKLAGLQKSKGLLTKDVQVPGDVAPSVPPMPPAADLPGYRSEITRLLVKSGVSPSDIQPEAIDRAAALIDSGQEADPVAAYARATAPAAPSKPTVAQVPLTDARPVHDVKMTLDRLINKGDPELFLTPSDTSSNTFPYGGIRAGLNRELEAKVPGYAEANAVGSAYHGEMGAFDNGLDALDNKQVWARDIRDPETGLPSIPSYQQEAYKRGMRSSIDQMLSNHPDPLGKSQRVMKSTAPADKIAAVFGQNPTDILQARLNAEQEMRDTYAAVLRGSKTQNKQAGTQFIDEAGLPEIPPSTTLTGGTLHLGDKVARHLYSGLVGRSKDATRDALATLYTAAPEQRDAMVQALLANRARAGQASDATSRLLAQGLAAAPPAANQRRIGQ